MELPTLMSFFSCAFLSKMRLQSYRNPVRKISNKPLIFGTILLLVVSICIGSFLHQGIIYMRRLESLLEEKESRIKEGTGQNWQHVVHKRSVEEVSPVRTESGTGITYVRWGRRECPRKTGTSLVYHGYAAGEHYSHVGGGSDFLCLHHNVTYTEGHYVEGHQGPSHIYGVEYRDSSNKYSLFDLSLIEEQTLQYQGVPCAVCLVRSPTKLMIPSRETCPDGWTIEYTGYIMTGGYAVTKHSSSHLCVDDTPQAVPGSQGNQNGAYLFVVELQCGHNVPCEPYVNNWEVRCVVCTLGEEM